jgi:hypothetical protein
VGTAGVIAGWRSRLTTRSGSPISAIKCGPLSFGRSLGKQIIVVKYLRWLRYFGAI